MDTKSELNSKIRSLDNQYFPQAVRGLRRRGLLRGTALCPAQPQNADLTSADLYKASQRGARNLTKVRLSEANTLPGSTMPGGSVYDGRFNPAGDLGLACRAGVEVSDSALLVEFYGFSFEENLEGQKHTAASSIAEERT
jgi:hypothetical protein